MYMPASSWDGRGREGCLFSLCFIYCYHHVCVLVKLENVMDWLSVHCPLGNMYFLEKVCQLQFVSHSVSFDSPELLRN